MYDRPLLTSRSQTDKCFVIRLYLGSKVVYSPLMKTAYNYFDAISKV